MRDTCKISLLAILLIFSHSPEILADQVILYLGSGTCNDDKECVEFEVGVSENSTGKIKFYTYAYRVSNSTKTKQVITWGLLDRILRGDSQIPLTFPVMIYLQPGESKRFAIEETAEEPQLSSAEAYVFTAIDEEYLKIKNNSSGLTVDSAKGILMGHPVQTSGYLPKSFLRP